MAWFLHATEQLDGRWACQHGRHTYDLHDELRDALQHLTAIAATMEPAELIVHYLKGTVVNVGLS